MTQYSLVTDIYIHLKHTGGWCSFSCFWSSLSNSKHKPQSHHLKLEEQPLKIWAFIQRVLPGLIRCSRYSAHSSHLTLLYRLLSSRNCQLIPHTHQSDISYLQIPYPGLSLMRVAAPPSDIWDKRCLLLGFAQDLQLAFQLWPFIHMCSPTPTKPSKLFLKLSSFQKLLKSFGAIFLERNFLIFPAHRRPTKSPLSFQH